MEITDNRKIRKRNKYELVVAGGGIAGVSAAVTAARKGVNTLLLEKSIQFGGLATAGLISWYEPLCNGKGKQLIKGIAEELLKLATKYSFDTLPEEWKKHHVVCDTDKRYTTYFSPTVFSLALDRFLADSNVHLLLDTMVVFPVMGDGRCEGVVVENKNGREFIPADYIIDATGDASVFYNAGIPTVEGENYLSYVAHGIDREAIYDYEKSGNANSLRKWYFCGSDLNGNSQEQKKTCYKGSSAEEITEFVLQGRKILFEKIKNDDRNEREILTLPTMPQFRKIRHIKGEYELNQKDKNKKIKNSMGTVGDFRNRGVEYDIPFECLYNKTCNNMLAAGRIISADDDGWEVARVIPVASFTGECAGNAVYLAKKDHCPLPEIDRIKLRNCMK